MLSAQALGTRAVLDGPLATRCQLLTRTKVTLDARRVHGYLQLLSERRQVVLAQELRQLAAQVPAAQEPQVKAWPGPASRLLLQEGPKDVRE